MKLVRWGLTCLGAAVLGLASLGAQAAPSAEARPAWCVGKGPSAFPSTGAAFDKVGAKLARREPITVVAIGSSSTDGSDLPDPRQAYPTHLEARLNAALGPGGARVLNRGRGGETMPETIARFERDVGAAKPDLVVWQLGVNDVVRDVPTEMSAERIEQGLATLARYGAPVVLMDMQFAPLVLRSRSLDGMHVILRKAALKHGALLWSRFDLMKGILEKGGAAMTDLVRADGLHMTPPMHACAGHKLGDALIGAMRRETLSAGY